MDVAKLLGTWQRPPDPVAWAALGVAALFVVEAFAKSKPDEALSPRRRFLAAVGFAAAFLSLGYVAHYLRGGPRIIDATTYFLQGRALSHGHFAWSVPDPSASFRGRFLLFTEPDRIAGIFPPGYPLLLAAGFLLGAPMLVGPVLAAAIAIATYFLAHELLHDARIAAARAEPVARTAAMLSLVCAALRNHTADTMSHGASALGIAVALVFALRARRLADPRLFALAGLATGYVAATRMPSALPIGIACVVLAWRAPARARAVPALLLGVVPGLALLGASQLASTGNLFASTQRAYYAVSDGPPGCFRYGFGAGVGCVGEHGEFVRDRLAHGYGVLEALGTTLRRLRLHAMDVANFEPLSLLVLLPFRSAARACRAQRVALAIVLGQIAAYAPFYFDGSYPGGGGRLFADVLPVEHAILVVSAASLAPSVRWPIRASVLLALACVGFAVHASHDHVRLANRDGGRPMFEPDVLRQSYVTSGLLLLDTDHGFNLAHDPGAAVSRSVLAARARGDDHDRLLWESLGRPPAHTYKLQDDGPLVQPFAPASSPDLWTFEAEADWPPLAQSGGFVLPEYTSGCAPRVLTVTPAPREGRATATLELPIPRDGKWSVTPRVLVPDPEARGAVYVLTDPKAPLSTASALWRMTGAQPGCLELEPREMSLRGKRAYLVVEAEAGRVMLDRTTLRAVADP